MIFVTLSYFPVLIWVWWFSKDLSGLNQDTLRISHFVGHTGLTMVVIAHLSTLWRRHFFPSGSFWSSLPWCGLGHKLPIHSSITLWAVTLFLFSFMHTSAKATLFSLEESGKPSALINIWIPGNWAIQPWSLSHQPVHQTEPCSGAHLLPCILLSLWDLFVRCACRVGFWIARAGLCWHSKCNEALQHSAGGGRGGCCCCWKFQKGRKKPPWWLLF